MTSAVYALRISPRDARMFVKWRALWLARYTRRSILVYDVALDAAYDFAPGFFFRSSRCGIGFGSCINGHAHNCNSVESGVGLPIAATVQMHPVVLPLEAGIGQTPQSLAKAA